MTTYYARSQKHKTRNTQLMVNGEVYCEDYLIATRLLQGYVTYHYWTVIYAITMEFPLSCEIPMKVSVDKFFMGNEIPMKCWDKILYPWMTHERVSFHVFVCLYNPWKTCEITPMKNVWKAYEIHS